MAEEIEDTLAGSAGPGPDTGDEPTPSVPGSEAPDEVTPEPAAEVEPVTEPEVVAEPEAKFEVEPEPVAEPVKIRVRQPVVVEPDALDQEFGEVLKAIDADELLSPSEKAVKKLDVKAKWEDRTERRQEKAQKKQETVWQTESAKTGVAAEQCELAWDQAIEETKKRIGSFDQNYATAIYHTKLDRMKPTAKPGVKPTQEPPKAGKVAAAASPGKGQIIPRGASGRVAQPTQDTRTVMERVRDGDKSMMKEIAEINRGFQDGE